MWGYTVRNRINYNCGHSLADSCIKRTIVTSGIYDMFDCIPTCIVCPSNMPPVYCSIGTLCLCVVYMVIAGSGYAASVAYPYSLDQVRSDLINNYVLMINDKLRYPNLAIVCFESGGYRCTFCLVIKPGAYGSDICTIFYMKLFGGV